MKCDGTRMTRIELITTDLITGLDGTQMTQIGRINSDQIKPRNALSATSYPSALSAFY
jgi:hypothetical protein